jgi:DNA polymerase III subunit epsilon
MNILYFDTETTGLLKYKLPISDPSQPRLVQLGAILTSGDEVMAEVNLLVKPEGFEIPKEASDIHGITTEVAMKFGMPVKLVMGTFIRLVNMADRVVAHNYDYDKKIAEIECDRLQVPYCLANKDSYCTMLSTTQILQLPGRFGYKWPKLAEAYEFFFKEKLEGAHDAMADIKGCKRVYLHLASLGRT